MTVIALPNGGPDLRIEAAIALPPLSPAERLVLAAATRTLFRGTRDYGRAAIEAITPDGTVSRLAEDHVRIGFSVAPARAAEGLSLLEAVLARASFFDETLGRAARSATVGSPWERAFGLPLAPPWNVKAAEAERVWSIVARPERLAIAFAGPGAEAARSAWLARRIEFPPRPDRREPGPTPPSSAPASIAIAMYDAPATLDGPTLLAIAALGIGKGSIAWRALREEAGESYRVEASLGGTARGWSARLRFDVESAEEAAAARGRLLGEIERLSEADRERAIGALEAGLGGDGPTPFELGPRDVREPAFMAAYLASKEAGPYDPSALLKAARGASLEELKARLRTFLEAASVSLR